MRIAVVTMAFNESWPATYLGLALRKKHEVELLGPLLLEKSFREKAHDIYVCVDNTQPDPLNIFESGYVADPLRLKNVSFWFTNWRRNAKKNFANAAVI